MMENRRGAKIYRIKKTGKTLAKKSTDNNKKLMKPIISGPILFDLIVNPYDDQKEFCLTLSKNLLDQCFLNLITYVYSSKQSIHQKKQETFFSLIKSLKDEYSSLFLSKCKILQTNDSVLRWWLGKAGVNLLEQLLSEKPKGNNYQNHTAAIFPLNNSSAQDRLTRFSSMMKTKS